MAIVNKSIKVKETEHAAVRKILADGYAQTPEFALISEVSKKVKRGDVTKNKRELAKSKSLVEAWGLFLNAMNSEQPNAMEEAIASSDEKATAARDAMDAAENRSDERIQALAELQSFSMVSSQLKRAKPEKRDADLERAAVAIAENKKSVEVHERVVKALISEDASVRKEVQSTYAEANKVRQDRIREAKKKSNAEGRKLRDKYRDQRDPFYAALLNTIVRPEFEFNGKTITSKPGPTVFTQAKHDTKFKGEDFRATVVVEFANAKLEEEIKKATTKTFDKYPQINKTSHQLMFIVNDAYVDVRVVGESPDLLEFVQKAVDIERLAGLKVVRIGDAKPAAPTTR